MLLATTHKKRRKIWDRQKKNCVVSKCIFPQPPPPKKQDRTKFTERLWKTRCLIIHCTNNIVEIITFNTVNLSPAWQIYNAETPWIEPKVPHSNEGVVAARQELERRLENDIQNACTTTELGAKTAHKLQPEEERALKIRKFMKENERISVFKTFWTGDRWTSGESLSNYLQTARMLHLNPSNIEASKTNVIHKAVWWDRDLVGGSEQTQTLVQAIQVINKECVWLMRCDLCECVYAWSSSMLLWSQRFPTCSEPLDYWRITCTQQGRLLQNNCLFVAI